MLRREARGSPRSVAEQRLSSSSSSCHLKFVAAVSPVPGLMVMDLSTYVHYPTHPRVKIRAQSSHQRSRSSTASNSTAGRVKNSSIIRHTWVSELRLRQFHLWPRV